VSFEKEKLNKNLSNSVWSSIFWSMELIQFKGGSLGQSKEKESSGCADGLS
jgi:hypothetical protein